MVVAGCARPLEGLPACLTRGGLRASAFRGERRPRVLDRAPACRLAYLRGSRPVMGLAWRGPARHHETARRRGPRGVNACKVSSGRRPRPPGLAVPLQRRAYYAKVGGRGRRGRLAGQRTLLTQARDGFGAAPAFGAGGRSAVPVARRVFTPRVVDGKGVPGRSPDGNLTKTRMCAPCPSAMPCRRRRGAVRALESGARCGIARRRLVGAARRDSPRPGAVRRLVGPLGSRRGTSRRFGPALPLRAAFGSASGAALLPFGPFGLPPRRARLRFLPRRDAPPRRSPAAGRGPRRRGVARRARGRDAAQRQPWHGTGWRALPRLASATEPRHVA